MKRPLFAVGEVVMLQSKNCPELNGEHRVREVVGLGESTVIDGVKKINVGTRPVYDLGVPGRAGHNFWDESALRKRHQPGEYSFDGLKQMLELPVSRGGFA